VLDSQWNLHWRHCCNCGNVFIVNIVCFTSANWWYHRSIKEIISQRNVNQIVSVEQTLCTLQLFELVPRYQTGQQKSGSDLFARQRHRSDSWLINNVRRQWNSLTSNRVSIKNERIMAGWNQLILVFHSKNKWNVKTSTSHGQLVAQSRNNWFPIADWFQRRSSHLWNDEVMIIVGRNEWQKGIK